MEQNKLGCILTLHNLKFSVKFKQMFTYLFFNFTLIQISVIFYYFFRFK